MMHTPLYIRTNTKYRSEGENGPLKKRLNEIQTVSLTCIVDDIFAVASLLSSTDCFTYLQRKKVSAVGFIVNTCFIRTCSGLCFYPLGRKRLAWGLT